MRRGVGISAHRGEKERGKKDKEWRNASEGKGRKGEKEKGKRTRRAENAPSEGNDTIIIVIMT